MAQREAYKVLRQNGVISTAVSRSDVGVGVEGKGSAEPRQPQALSPSELREPAETCVAMLEVHGQSIGVTLAGITTDAGGSLLAEEVPKVCELAEAIAAGSRKEE